MAEDTYRQHKKEEQNVNVDSIITQGSFRLTRPIVSARGRIVGRGAVRFQRAGTVEGDYSTFKATVAAAVQEIKTEIREQHQLTRTEVQTTRRDILAAIKSSPAECVKLMSEFGLLFLLFSLAIRFTLKIELVNPAFALFMIFAFGLYWIMATVKQHSDKVKSPAEKP